MVRVGGVAQQDLGSGTVTGVRGGDHHPQQQAERVDHDTPRAPVDQLAAVEAAAVDADDRVRLDRLRVDHCGGRLRVPPRPHPDLRAQPVVNSFASAYSRQRRKNA
nr:hypothetical protein [Streptomyces europaeiscabiei]